MGADNYEIGKLAGTYISEALNGQGKIMEIWGLRGSTPAIERDRGRMPVHYLFPEMQLISLEIKDASHETVSHAWYNSPTLGLTRIMYVYTPPGYDDKKNTTKYSVLYLLHGEGGDEEAFRVGEVLEIKNDKIIASRVYHS